MELSPMIATETQQITAEYAMEHSKGTNTTDAQRQARTQQSTQRNIVKTQIRQMHEDRNDTNTVESRTLQHNTTHKPRRAHTAQVEEKNLGIEHEWAQYTGHQKS
ncbi:unnamed protein product [Prunus armeniaca]